MKTVRAIGSLAAFLGLYAALSTAIVTPFIDVDMGLIAAGKAVPVQAPGGAGLLLFNKEEKAVRVHVEVVGLPDAGWVRIEPRDPLIAPHDHVLCRMMVFVPNAKKFRRQRYQALIRTRMEFSAPSRMGVEAALQSQLRFEVE